MKRLLITGSSGLLGSNIHFEIGSRYETYGIYREHPNVEIKNQFKADLTYPEQIKDIVETVKPDFVIHCAALTSVELCESDYDVAYKANVLATSYIVSSVNVNTKFIYISTDSQFDGKKGNYSEEDTVSPLNNYAKTKLEGEWVVEQKLKNYVIVRTNIFGKNRIGKESFAEWIINSLHSRKEIKMFTDVIFSPLMANSLAIYLNLLLNSDFTGKINIAASNSITKFEFGLFLAKTLGLNPSLIRPSSIDLFSFKAKRPKNTSLDVSKAKRIFGELPSVEEEIIKFTKFLKLS